MRVLSGLLLQACVTLGRALAALFVVLLRPSLLHLASCKAESLSLKVHLMRALGQKRNELYAQLFFPVFKISDLRRR